MSKERRATQELIRQGHSMQSVAYECTVCRETYYRAQKTMKRHLCSKECRNIDNNEAAECERCGKSFRNQVKGGHIKGNGAPKKPRKFCSSECFNSAKVKRVACMCEKCGSIFSSVPISNGGSSLIENMQWLHSKVNRAKGAMTNDEFIALCEAVVSTKAEKAAQQRIGRQRASRGVDEHPSLFN